jgi:choline kinase
MAAGLGSRLGGPTPALPKALIAVANQPLIAHALRFAAWLSPTRIIVVGGFGFDRLAAEIEHQRKTANLPPIALVENRNFRDGNLLSLLTARPLIDDEFVLLNVDHIFRPAIAAVVAAPVDDVTAFIDTDRILGDDDMKIERDGAGHVGRIAKNLTTFDCGYVGVTRVPRTALPGYFSQAEAAVAEDGRAIHVERILARLASVGTPPRCRDISGHGWLEIDTPDDRSRAEAALRQPGWA